MPKTYVRGFDGAELARRRRARSWTQRDLAFAANTTLTTLQKWEGGWSRPDPTRAGRVAEALQCTVRELVSLADDDVLPADVRAWAGHSVTTAAAELSMTRAALAEIENGYRKPSSNDLQGLAKLTDITPEQYKKLWHRARRQLQDRLGMEES